MAKASKTNSMRSNPPTLPSENATPEMTPIRFTGAIDGSIALWKTSDTVKQTLIENRIITVRVRLSP